LSTRSNTMDIWSRNCTWQLITWTLALSKTSAIHLPRPRLWSRRPLPYICHYVDDRSQTHGLPWRNPHRCVLVHWISIAEQLERIPPERARYLGKRWASRQREGLQQFIDQKQISRWESLKTTDGGFSKADRICTRCFQKDLHLRALPAFVEESW
jgi:hypothetical protein